MVFSSNIFLFLFLPMYLLAYYISTYSWKSYVIVAGSYLFYAWWRPDFLLLFLGLSVWNYYFGIKIHEVRKDNKKKAFRYLTVGVIGNLLVLGYFKYVNFGAETLISVLESIGFNTFTFENIILPLGISFYVFQAISYIVDIYRKQAEPTRRFVDFAAFIALFPQLIAGPILRYNYIAEQLNQRTHSWELFSLGATRFMLGFTKKVLIADSIAPLNSYLMSSGDSGIIDTWFAVAASLVQLYFDFSAYSDMAIGLGMMMGFRFKENFNQPFMARSLTEFWRRWHLTLADFLRDYVFLPLVKSKKINVSLALFFTMTLSGFWHGANFSFICFGAYFGIIMVIERHYGWDTKVKSEYNIWRNLLAILLLLVCMPFFMAGDLTKWLEIFQGQYGFRGIGSFDAMLVETTQLAVAFFIISIIWMIVAGIIQYRYMMVDKNNYFMKDVTGWKSVMIWCGFILSLTKLSANSFSPFLYFQF